jgi:hypothetical protein
MDPPKLVFNMDFLQGVVPGDAWTGEINPSRYVSAASLRNPAAGGNDPDCCDKCVVS